MADETKALEPFVERVGEFFARTGHQRTAGRVLGWLLVCDPPRQSADDLQRVTGASKASISITLRVLIANDLVERVGVTGRRQAHYQLRPGCWTTDLRGKLAQFTALRELAEEGLALMVEAPPDRRARLEGMRDLYAFFEREFPGLVERWLAERGAGP